VSVVVDGKSIENRSPAKITIAPENAREQLMFFPSSCVPPGLIDAIDPTSVIRNQCRRCHRSRPHRITGRDNSNVRIVSPSIRTASCIPKVFACQRVCFDCSRSLPGDPFPLAVIVEVLNPRGWSVRDTETGSQRGDDWSSIGKTIAVPADLDR